MTVTTGKKGDVVCRPGDWMDVAKFFLFNFLVHAVTVVNAPGAKTLRSVNTSLTAILLPFSGAYRAFQSMAFYRWAKEDDLHIALRAQALCTTIPSEHHPTGHVLFPSLNVIEVHGQHSVPTYGFLEWTGIKATTLRPSYQLSRVPWWFAITPLKPPARSTSHGLSSTSLQTVVEHNPMPETKISCDYNIMKIFAAILQILSGLFQIYQSRGTQLDRYGYSAYSLTVIPYVLMSLVNLLVCICIPQYPMMYIVHYGGKKRPIPESRMETPEISRALSLAQISHASSSADISRAPPPTEILSPEDRPTATGTDLQADVPGRSISPMEQSIGEQESLLRGCSPTTGDEPQSSSSSTSSAELVREDADHFEWESDVKEMVSGVVGVAYGEWEFGKRDTTLPQSKTSVSQQVS